MTESEPRLDVMTYLAQTAPEPKPDIPHSPTVSRSHWQRTEIYSSHGCRYCRFRWGKGSETWGYLHISGGDANTPLVQQRQQTIDEMIRAGASLEEIKRTIAGWSNAKPGRKPF